MSTTDKNDFDGGDPRAGARDRVFDALLHEAVRGEAVPDLTARVRARLGTGVERADPGLVRLPRGRSRVVAAVFGTMLGAAATALVTAHLLGRHDDAAGPRYVAWHVVEGCLQWQSASAGETVRSGERALWPIAQGDRLRTCEELGAVCDLASLGRLNMSKGTEIEVAAMEWKSFGGGTALGAVTVAVIGGVIRWSGGGDVAQAKTGESLELRAQSPTLAAARIDELSQQVAALQKDLADQEARARDLEAKAARTVASNAEQVAAATPAAAPPALKHAVTYAGMDPALSAIDWDVTGKCMHGMLTKIDEVYAALEKGEEMPLKALGEVSSLNAELIKQAVSLIEADVPGTGPNGVFTNPVVAANQLHATLTKAGQPLSDAQRDSLQRISAQVAGEDEARRAALPKDGFELAEVIGETDLKDRFYREARAMLTPEQERAIFPDRLAGTTANLFSTGLVWAQFARPVEVRDRAHFGESVSDSIASALGLGNDMTPQVRATVLAWAQKLPDDAFAAPDKLSGMGLGKLGPIKEAATRQLALLQELGRTLTLTPEQLKKLRNVKGVYMPRKK